MRNLPPHELYALKLQCLDLGYALFEPNPNGAYDFVRIGDVGYISEDGKFMKIFNAFGDRDSQANAGSQFPNAFEPIGEAYRGEDRLEPISPGLRRSQSVTMVGGSLSFSGPISEFIAGGSLTLSCTNNMGAALITKYKGKRQKALASTAMEDYMKCNVISWLQLAHNLGRPVQMHDLIFVKECVLTGDWANVSWNSINCESSIGFTVGLPTMASLGISFWGQWQQHVDVPKRQGPDRETPISDEEVPDLNQCAFIKGIRIAERAWYDKLAHHLRVTSRKGRSPGPSVLKVLSDKDFKVQLVGDRNSSFNSVRNAYDALAAHIFENSSAAYALIDERDIYYMNLHKANTLNEIRNTHGEIVARLSWDERGATSAQSDLVDDLVLLDENMVPLEVSEDDTPQRTGPETVGPLYPRYSPPTTYSGVTLVDSEFDGPLLDDLPPPPLPVQFPGTGFKTVLYNYVACKRISDFKVIQKADGPAHKPTWTTIYRIGGVGYGSSTQSRKKASAEEAARHALTKLWNEHPDQHDVIRGEIYGYPRTFRKYLSDHGLSETIRFSYAEKELRHQGWVCRIHSAEKVFGIGEGRTKKMAAQQASVRAARDWTKVWNS